MFSPVRWILFGAVSILLLIFTLLRPYRHRFYRFLAFETLLALIFVNAGAWFLNPLSTRQILSWGLLTASFLLALHGFRLLQREGLPDGDIEKTTRLVTSGAYRYIRHPLYCSLLLFGVGAFLKAPSIPGIVLLALLTGFLIATARVEERDNIERFGEAYRNYMTNTRMFIPFLL